LWLENGPSIPEHHSSRSQNPPSLQSTRPVVLQFRQATSLIQVALMSVSIRPGFAGDSARDSSVDLDHFAVAHDKLPAAQAAARLMNTDLGYDQEPADIAETDAAAARLDFAAILAQIIAGACPIDVATVLARRWPTHGSALVDSWSR
jgi:hypothetical protein